MTVDWTKPIEAVNKETGWVIPMTFKEFDRTDGEPITEQDPYDNTDQGCWKLDGSSYFSWQDAWSIRNVKRDRTFKYDDRGNPELHKLYVGSALDILKVVAESIDQLDDFSNLNALGFAAELRKERAKLVKENAAYFEAAAILYVGKDWIDNA